jgi:DMSO/TMAO reductase YedYZ molybdopterin-dependent catalytic subunit
MNHKENRDDSLQPQDASSANKEPKQKQEMAKSPAAVDNDASPSAPMAVPTATASEKPEAFKATKQEVGPDRSRSLAVDHTPRTNEAASSVAANQAIAEVPEGVPEDANPSVGAAVERSSIENEAHKTTGAIEQQVDADRSPSSSLAHDPRTNKAASSVAVKSVSAKKPRSFFAEQPPPAIEIAPRVLRYRSRRDFLAFGAGALAALAGGAFLLPQETLGRIGIHRNIDSPRKEWLLNRALRIDDDVAEALYSVNRSVPTYTKSQITPLKNNYNGSTPDPGYMSGWKLTVAGLASGLSISLDIQNLLTRFPVHEQITRLVCVEGWSAVAWWAGLRFDDLIRAYPPMSQAKWALVESSVNLDASGNLDPYFMALDLATLRHPQTLLATHFNGQPLTVDHGAPLRLLVPVKLGLKNVKAITRIAYVAEEPRDYWAERGYSRYDGI